MSKQVLITGGAGFIGSHLADELLAQGYRVRALDILSPQVHGPAATRPAYLDSRVELIRGDVCDPLRVRHSLIGVDAVFHFAAAVGVGQSMYEIEHYCRTNDVGTAVLLEEIIRHRVERLIVASSMSVYGEGLYRAADGTVYDNVSRALPDLQAGRWEPTAPDGSTLTPIATDESKTNRLASVYALNKFDQEKMCLMVGRAYSIPTLALRFFNVYGPRQALSNPYTGVLAIFASRLLNNNPPLIFEDGGQIRDFVHVTDVARACAQALSCDADGEAINVGSGRCITIAQLAELFARVVGKRIEPQITGEYRTGDIRHCFADISRARRVLGYEPRVGLEEGLKDLAEWLSGQEAADRVGEAREALITRGLAV